MPAIDRIWVPFDDVVTAVDAEDACHTQRADSSVTVPNTDNSALSMRISLDIAPYNGTISKTDRRSRAGTLPRQSKA
jgi:hypothetical protein